MAAFGDAALRAQLEPVCWDNIALVTEAAVAASRELGNEDVGTCSMVFSHRRLVGRTETPVLRWESHLAAVRYSYTASWRCSPTGDAIVFGGLLTKHVTTLERLCQAFLCQTRLYLAVHKRFLESIDSKQFVAGSFPLPPPPRQDPLTRQPPRSPPGPLLHSHPLSFFREILQELLRDLFTIWMRLPMN